jgi:hypothetical protein
MVFEFQNSPMPLQELQARENYYGNMIWIVNGVPFLDKFSLLGRLPSNEAAWADDCVFKSQHPERLGRCFWRKSEQPNYQPGDLVLIHTMDEIQDDIDKDYVGHHFYHWLRPRHVWFESTQPVYVDFGGDLLWHFQRYRGSDLEVVQGLRKSTLISPHGGNYVDTGNVVLPAKRPRRNGDPVFRNDGDVILSKIR